VVKTLICVSMAAARPAGAQPATADRLRTAERFNPTVSRELAGSLSRTGVLSRDRLLVPMPKALTNVEVVARQGTNYAPAGEVVTAAGGIRYAATLTNQWTVLRSTRAPRPRPVTAAQKIPVSDQAVFAVSPTQVVHASLFVMFDEVPVPWRTEDWQYATTLRVGFECTDFEAVKRRAPYVAVHLQGRHLACADNLVKIERPGIDGLQAVKISARRFKPDATVTATSDLGGEAFSVPIERLGIRGLVQQVFPGPVLFAVLLGGGAGGFLRTFKARRRRRSAWYWFVAEGCLSGVIFVAVLMAVGVARVLPAAGAAVAFTGLAVFGLAALAGYLGTHAIDFVANRLFQSEESSATQTPAGD
jgi:hypothetical protein